MRTAAVLLLAGSTGVAAAAPPPAPQERLAVQVRSELSTGGFDAPAGIPLRQDTVRLRYRGDGWIAQAEVPWLRVLGAGQGAPSPGSGVAQGLGNVRLKWMVPLRAPGPDATGLDLVLRLKTGSGARVGGVAASDPGQGLRLEAQRPLGRWSAFGHVGWRRAGDLPGTAAARQAWHAELGVSRPLASGLEVGAFVDWRQRTGRFAPLREAALYAGWNERGWGWNVFVARSWLRSGPEGSAGLAVHGSF